MSWVVTIEDEKDKSKSVKYAQYINDMMEQVRLAAEQLAELGNDGHRFSKGHHIKVHLLEHPDD
jgi:hypothetical protein